MLTPADRMVSAGLCDNRFRKAAASPLSDPRVKAMKFASTRLIAADIKALVTFYERVTGQTAEWLAPVFAEIVTPAATLAIGSAETVALFKVGSAEPAANRTAIIEFQVSDVDAEFARLKGELEVVHEPKMMPWGNRATQFRDPEGTLVSLYTPVTDAAKQRFGSR
jgi:uncharacterized glyoxalase superfamily protein PhnB